MPKPYPSSADTDAMVARVAPVVTSGRGAVLVMHDITELRRADQVRRDFVANMGLSSKKPRRRFSG